jgi:hypothetical protein
VIIKGHDSFGGSSFGGFEHEISGLQSSSFSHGGINFGYH